MSGRECYHCRQWIEDKDRKSHDCWTTTEETLTQDLPEDLRDAWYRIRETAAEFGEQRVYASHKSIMFSRKACYFFVRPKKNVLEVYVFLGRTVRHPRIRKSQPASKTKVGHLIHVKHRDEVEAPITDWLKEAYTKSDELSSAARGRTPSKKSRKKTPKKSPKKGKKKAKAK